MRSAPPRLPVLHAVLYETDGTSAHNGAKMVGNTRDSKTPDDEENPDPLPRRWAGYPERFIQLPSL